MMRASDRVIFNKCMCIRTTRSANGIIYGECWMQKKNIYKKINKPKRHDKQIQANTNITIRHLFIRCNIDNTAQKYAQQTPHSGIERVVK